MSNEPPGSQISLPVPVCPVSGTGGCHTRAGVSRPGALEEVSGLRLGEGTGPLTFTVRGMKPVGQGAIRHGNGGHGYHANGKVLKPWREAVQQAAIRATGRHAYIDPYKRNACGVCGVAKNRHGLFLGAVCLFAVVTFAKPNSDPDRRFPITQNIGDYDHHARAIGDALTGVIWADDAQVVDGRTVKTYIGEHPNALNVQGAVIRIWELTP